MWLENDRCHDTVANAWEAVSSDPPMRRVMQNLEACQTQLKRWSEQSFCNVANTLIEEKKSLKEAEEAAVKGGSLEFFLQLKSEVADLLRLEEQMW